MNSRGKVFDHVPKCGECGSDRKIKSVYLPNGKRSHRCIECRRALDKLRVSRGNGMWKPKWKAGNTGA